jgi:hypothetical protein
MDNIFTQEQYESDDSSSEEEVYNRPNNTFMNMTKLEDFEKNQKLLFNRDIVKKNIVIDSHNYYQGDDGDGRKFNTSNITVLFDLEDEPTENYQEKITTNYDIFKNVIGFRLLKSTIRTPPYNVNTTNNVIKYTRTNTVKIDGSTSRSVSDILTITINPGVYTAEDLAKVFQTFNGYYDEEDTSISESRSDIQKKNAQFATYSDGDTGFNRIGTSEISTVYTTSLERQWSPWLPRTGNQPSRSISGDPDKLPPLGLTDNSFRVQFLDTNFKSDNEQLQIYPFNGPLKSENVNCSGAKFLFEFDSAEATTQDTTTGEHIQKEEFEILWDYNSVTRGAARLFGFSPTKIKSSNRQAISNKMPNFDSQYVDLVIPEIPSVACKKNSSGREIIERIQLKEGHGEYLHYKTPNDGIEQQYFNPMKLHRLTAQLWAVNNVLYDNNNSDISYEFEITMIKNKKLLI